MSKQTKIKRKSDEKSKLLNDRHNIHYVEVNASTDLFIEDDDAVIASLKQLSITIQFIICLWLISFDSFLLSSIFTSISKLMNTTAFVMSLIGHIIGIYQVSVIWIRLCRCPELTTREKINYAHSQGIRLSSISQFMEYDSLPLLRSLLFCTCVIGCFLLLSALSQILFMLWSVYGIIGLWYAITPVIIIFVVILLYVYCIKSFTSITCFNLTILFADGLLICAKSHHQSILTWIVIIFPLLVSQLLWTIEICRFLWFHFQARYCLTINQKIASFAYLTSFVLGIIAEFVLASSEYTSTSKILISENLSNTTTFPIICKILFVLSGTFFLSGVWMIIRHQTSIIIKTKGFVIPNRLSWFNDGWQSMEYRHDQSLLLGSITVMPMSLIGAVRNQNVSNPLISSDAS